MKRKDNLGNLWDDAVGEISCLADEMRSWEEGMSNSEGLSATYKYQTVSDTADLLEDAREMLLEDIKIPVELGLNVVEVKIDGSKRLTRPKRLQNSLIILNIFLNKLEGEDKENLEEVFNNLSGVEFPSMFG